MNKAVAITGGVKVTVSAYYMHDQSNSYDFKHTFAYKVRIKNQTGSDIRLIRRSWIITDSMEGRTMIDGTGVVGKTPLLKPGEEFAYVSSVCVRGFHSTMVGSYLFMNLNHPRFKQFNVAIPSFDLIVPHINN